MAFSRPEPGKRRPGALGSLRKSPLFGVAILMFLGLTAYIAYLFATDFTSPKRYVVVDAYAVGLSQAASGVRLELTRITYQPGYDLRLSGAVRESAVATLWIDGVVANDSAGTRAIFFPAPEGRSVVIRADGREWTPGVSMVAPGACPSHRDAALLQAGEQLRFSLPVPVQPGAESRWVYDAVRSGRMPAISLGDFAEAPDCTAAARERRRWRIDFSSALLAPAEAQDFFPFGAPTAREIGINGRRYWSPWVPRVGPPAPG